MKISSSNNLSRSTSHDTSAERGYGLMRFGVAGLALLGGAQARHLTQSSTPGTSPAAPSGSGSLAVAPPSPTGAASISLSPPPLSPSPVAPLPPASPAVGSSPASQAPGGVPPGQLMAPAPVGQLVPVAQAATQGSAVPAWLAAVNTTSTLPMAWSANVNHTDVPGLGPVVLPSPLASIEGNLPASLMSPWYDYMTQPAIPDGLNYTTTMQGPYYYWGVLFDRGANNQISSNAVMQGYVGDCAIGATIIALAESGFFQSNFPLGIAAGAPKPYFDVRLFSSSGQAETQNIDDMLPWSEQEPTVDGFLGYQPTPDGLNTRGNEYNANAVLAVPYLEKGLAKYFDRNPQLKFNRTLMGYAGLANVQASAVLSAFRGFQGLVVLQSQSAAENWMEEIGYCMQTPQSPCVFGTVDTSDALKAKASTWNQGTLTATFPDGETLQMTNPTGNMSLLVYRQVDGSAPSVFVAEHAYGMMRNGLTNANVAALGNPWHANPDVNGNVGGSRVISVSQRVLSRVMVQMSR